MKIENANYNADECRNTFTFSLIRENGLDGTISIKWRTVAGTAVKGTNYETNQDDIVFLNQQVRTIANYL